jgi:hypothetical protein
VAGQVTTELQRRDLVVPALALLGAGLVSCQAWVLTYLQEPMADVTGARFAYSSALCDSGDWTDHLSVAVGVRAIGQHVPGHPEVLGALSIRDGQIDPLSENWLLGLMWFLPGLLSFVLGDLRGHEVASIEARAPWRSPRKPGDAIMATVGAITTAFLLRDLVVFAWLPQHHCSDAALADP